MQQRTLYRGGRDQALARQGTIVGCSPGGRCVPRSERPGQAPDGTPRQRQAGISVAGGCTRFNQGAEVGEMTQLATPDCKL